MTLPTTIPATEWLPLVRDAAIFVLALFALWAGNPLNHKENWRTDGRHQDD